MDASTLNLKSLLAERNVAMCLLQDEVSGMSVSCAEPTAARGHGIATASDISAVAAATNLEELEISLIALDREGRQRRADKICADAAQWAGLRRKYQAGPSDEDPVQTAAEKRRSIEESLSKDPLGSPLPTGKNSHSITLEEFQRKIVWEKWTGNCSCPAELDHLLYPVDSAVAGQDISMVKPSAWLVAQSSLKQKRSTWTQSKARSGDAAENLSFVDFLKSLPVFHSVRVADLSEMERDCPSEAYRYSRAEWHVLFGDGL